MKYNEYYDKVYGCFIGKAASGNIGAPYEGMKQLLGLKFDRGYLENILPNDDLDLQVLWLEALEKHGVNVTKRHLADLFLSRCPYAPGEYAYFKRNYAKKIDLSICGEYNNSFFRSGNGCPIRSEIWACLFPNKPELATKICLIDGTLDHPEKSESVYGEIYFTALESMAFGESDVDKLIAKALDYIPSDSKIYKAVSNVIDWCKEEKDYKVVRSRIIRNYGNAEATDCVQNTAIVVMSIIYEKDFIENSMLACNCGFDTDCTCATTGSIMGIIYGADYLNKKYNLPELTYKLGVNTKRRSDLIVDLAEDVAKMGVYFAENTLGAEKITDFDFEVPVIESEKQTLDIKVNYENGCPAIGFGESNKIAVEVINKTDEQKELSYKINETEYVKVDNQGGVVKVKANDKAVITVTLSVSKDEKMLPETNILQLILTDGDKNYTFEVGISGKRQLKIYGPYWKNIVTVPQLKFGQSYWDYINGTKTEEEFFDKIRHYHMQSYPDTTIVPDKAHVYAEDVANVINADCDFIKLEDYEKFVGQASYYVSYDFYSSEEKVVGFQAGFTGPVEIYLNGKKIIAKDECFVINAENAHAFNLKILKGENNLTIRVSKLTNDTYLNFNFVSDKACSDHVFSFSNINKNF